MGYNYNIVRIWTLGAALCAIAGCSVMKGVGDLFSGSSKQEQAPFSSPSATTSAQSSKSKQAVSRVEAPAKSDDAPARKQAASPATPKKTGRIEVIWEIPKDSVDGYVVRYGYSREKLEFEEKVPASALQRFEDPQFGFVYRYLLQNVTPGKAIFVSLVAYNGNQLSAPSVTFEVLPKR